MLLSFAQFEREITAERIRDKIAASKAKGMWMGGNPPLGYAPNGRSLKIVDVHAELVGEIFRRYLDSGNVRILVQELDRDKIRLPERLAMSGRATGGGKFTRGQLYRILTNPVYAGKIVHHDKVYDGQHNPIVSDELWNEVRDLLDKNRQGYHAKGNRAFGALLAGLAQTSDGRRLKSGGFVTFLRDIGFQYLALVIHSTPQIMPFAVDLHKHLVEVPAPVPKAAHPVDALPADVCCEQWAEPVPPEPHRLVADVDSALEQQVFDIAQRQWKANIHHHDKPDDFG